jgi:O-antigen/teichoic acid export membrane protein
MTDAQSQPASKAGLHPFVAFLFASVGYVVLQLMLTPIRIKLMTTLLTKEQYGVLTLAIMSVSCVAALVSCGSFEYLLRKAPGQPAAVQQGLLRMAFIFFGGLSIAVSAIGVTGLVWCMPPIPGFPVPAILACGIGVVAYLHLLTKAFYLLSCGRPIPYRATQFLYADIWFLPLVLILLVYPLHLAHILWVWVGWLALTILATWRLTPLTQAAERRHIDVRLRDMIAFGLPLLPMVFGEWLFRLGDRYVVITLLDPEALANYSLCMNIALIAYMIGLNMIALILPDFNRLKNTLTGDALTRPWQSAELRRIFSLMLRYSLVFSLVGGAALTLVGPHILLVLSDPKFLDAAVIFPWAAPASLFFLLQAVFNRTLMALDRSPLVGGLTLACAALNVGLNLVLVPHLQERGAALATGISLACLAGASGVCVQAWRWVDWAELKPLPILLSAALSAAGMYAARQALPQQNLLVVVGVGGWSALMIFAAGVMKLSDIRLLLAGKAD